MLKKVGLALGAGGLRGTAHIGVLQVFRENSIPIDVISGSSAGAVVAALYTAGIEPDELADLARNLNKYDVYDYNIRPLTLFYMWVKVLLDFVGINFPFFPKAPMGIIKGDRLEQLLLEFTSGKTFHEARIPTAITAVDINAGERVVFGLDEPVTENLKTHTYLGLDTLMASAVRASTAIPCVFEPKTIGNRVLVDGAVLDPVPADPAAALGAEFIIAVDVAPAESAEPKVDNIVEVALKLPEVVGGELARVKLKEKADIIIKPLRSDVGLTDQKMIEQCIKDGRTAAEEALPQIKNLLSNEI